MTKNTVKSIRLAPFSNKYKEYVRDCETSEINCLEGAIRSGKTIVNLIAFSHYIDNHSTGGLFLASSKTSGLAWEILAECRGNSSEDGKWGADVGFGLLYLFRGRCHKTKIKGSMALSLINKNKKKCDILFVGAANKGSKEAIRGLTIQGWIGTELENHICETDDDFVGFALGRLTGAVNPKVFWDLNPVYPSHRIYSEYIDVYNSSNSTVDFNYKKCLMTDNSSLSDRQIQRLLSKYKDKNSVMYKRDILGDRASASGLIFTDFAANKYSYIINDLSGYLDNSFISIGIDFGGNGSNTSFCATLIDNNFKFVIPFADDEIKMSEPGNATVDVYRQRLTAFIERIQKMNLKPRIEFVFCDSADTVMCNETRNLIWKICPTASTGNCDKWTIHDRITLLSAMMCTEHYKIYKDCTYLIKSLETQVWNTAKGHEDERLDDGTADIDIADAGEYSWSKFHQQLTLANTP